MAGFLIGFLLVALMNIGHQIALRGIDKLTSLIKALLLISLPTF